MKPNGDQHQTTLLLRVLVAALGTVALGTLAFAGLAGAAALFLIALSAVPATRAWDACRPAAASGNRTSSIFLASLVLSLVNVVQAAATAPLWFHVFVDDSRIHFPWLVPVFAVVGVVLVCAWCFRDAMISAKLRRAIVWAQWLALPAIFPLSRYAWELREEATWGGHGGAPYWRLHVAAYLCVYGFVVLAATLVLTRARRREGVIRQMLVDLTPTALVLTWALVFGEPPPYNG
ncbi:hypothetical protein A7982_13801 [Minicystis rosea]|nr:hypothetical protein A7982_13801 [Minicystis rosea]